MSQSCNPTFDPTRNWSEANQEQMAQANRGKVLTSLPYFSRVVFEATSSGGGVGTPRVYALPEGQERKAFGYAPPDNVPGLTVDAQARTADTNLLTRNQTIGNQALFVVGLGIIANGPTDAAFLRLHGHNISVGISIDGKGTQYPMGNLLNLPGPGGLYNAGHSDAIPPELSSAVAFDSAMGLGWPQFGFRPVPEGIIWKNAGQPDSNFAVILKNDRAFALTGNDRAAAAGIQVFTTPTIIRLDVTVHLIGATMSARSANS